ncbi:hypothetical protein KI387_026036, partial [Taxus chinensis]
LKEAIRIRTIIEDNEFLKAMKDETLGGAERLEVLNQKCEALVVAQDPHKKRLDELGNIIEKKMDLLEGRMYTMGNIMLALQNEKREITQDELESIVVNILEKVETAL